VAYDEVGAWSGRSHPPNAVVVGFNGKDHSRAALAWGTEEAAGRGAPLLVLFAANYPGMTAEPGPGLLHRDPGALEAAEEVTQRGVSQALEADPGTARCWRDRGDQPCARTSSRRADAQLCSSWAAEDTAGYRDVARLGCVSTSPPGPAVPLLS
jgi:hypothetical protein